MYDPDNNENDIGQEIAKAEAIEIYEEFYKDIPVEQRPSFEEFCEANKE